jgi:predicted DNA-binding protein
LKNGFNRNTICNTGDIMTSVRLDKSIEAKLDMFSKLENISKSELIKVALDEYFKNHEPKVQPYVLGEDLFGQFGSGEIDNSKNYKQKLKDKLNEKHTH